VTQWSDTGCVGGLSQRAGHQLSGGLLQEGFMYSIAERVLIVNKKVEDVVKSTSNSTRARHTRWAEKIGNQEMGSALLNMNIS